MPASIETTSHDRNGLFGGQTVRKTLSVLPESGIFEAHFPHGPRTTTRSSANEARHPQIHYNAPHSTIHRLSETQRVSNDRILIVATDEIQSKFATSNPTGPTSGKGSNVICEVQSGFQRE
jgi:hypothetical protein